MKYLQYIVIAAPVSLVAMLFGVALGIRPGAAVGAGVVIFFGVIAMELNNAGKG